MTFQKKIKVLLADRKVYVIAGRIGIHPVTLSNYLNENRKANPSAETVNRLARILSVDAGWLMDSEREWPPVPCKNPILPPNPNQIITA